MAEPRIAYLDHAATTPMRPEAVAAMLPFFTERFGNPSGSHTVARSARLALDEARETLAAVAGADPGEVIMTGSGTEADNLAITGIIGQAAGVPVCSAAEHHAVLHACLAAGGRVVPMRPDGVIDLEALADTVGTLGGEVSVVSVMLANNEVGTIQPLDEVVAIVRELAPGAVVHTDAVQGFPWLDVAACTAGADLVALSAHKFGGPKGVGALIARQNTALRPIIHGGGQERDRRSGTHNMAGIVAMVAAATATAAQRQETVARISTLRDRLADGLLGAVPDAVETGTRSTKIAGNCHLRFPGTESEALLVLLDDEGVCASAGSACASGAIEPSHVLTAMGMSPAEANSSIRFSLGATTTDADVELALQVVPKAVAQLRG